MLFPEYQRHGLLGHERVADSNGVAALSRAQEQIFDDGTRSLPGRTSTRRAGYCICGHLSVAHADGGKGGCEGQYSTIDTEGTYAGPCGCLGYKVALS